MPFEPHDVFLRSVKELRVLVQQPNRPVAISAQEASDLATVVVVVDVQWALSSRWASADRAHSALPVKQFLVVGEADPIESLEIASRM
jgi:hypothetical protein